MKVGIIHQMINAAYYNPSGITLSTIGLTIMVTVGYKREKTIELMGFTAEKRRLIGSREIAPKYKKKQKTCHRKAEFGYGWLQRL